MHELQLGHKSDYTPLPMGSCFSLRWVIRAAFADAYKLPIPEFHVHPFYRTGALSLTHLTTIGMPKASTVGLRWFVCLASLKEDRRDIHNACWRCVRADGLLCYIQGCQAEQIV